MYLREGEQGVGCGMEEDAGDVVALREPVLVNENVGEADMPAARCLLMVTEHLELEMYSTMIQRWTTEELQTTWYFSQCRSCTFCCYMTQQQRGRTVP